jgi:hypothetical protein
MATATTATAVGALAFAALLESCLKTDTPNDILVIQLAS